MSAIAYSRSECFHGHAFTPKNAVIYTEGWRCRACFRKYWHAQDTRRRAIRDAAKAERFAALPPRSRLLTNLFGEGFADRVQFPEGSTCWQWVGSRSREGYGKVKLQGQICYTHRASYEAFCGPIPSGLTIDHVCRNTSCCNPSHLDLVTQAENNRRSMRWAS